MLILTVMVLTADDVSFAVGHTESVEDDIDGPTLAACMDVKERSGITPDLIFAFPPLLEKHSCDYYIFALEKACGKIPIFGSVAVDDWLNYDTCSTFCNGIPRQAGMSFIFVAGNINPRFMIGTFSQRNLLPYSGEITKSEGNIIYEVNNMKAYDYFNSIGLAKNGEFNKGVEYIPFMLDAKKLNDYDGVPVVRGVVAFNKDGSAICRGNMYQNSIFTIGSCNKEDVLETSLLAIDTINKLKDVHAVIMFSCLVRRMAFGSEPLTEIQAVTRQLKPEIPYLIGYAGGELCPTSVTNKVAVNRFHNYSFVACIL